MKAPTNKSKAGRAGLVCAALGVSLGLVIWGCLNPRPEDFPSNDPLEVPEPPSGEEFCRDNPLAADCDDTDEPYAPGASGGQGTGGSASDPGPDAPDAPITPVGNVDAGATDAGAPDAGPSANK